MTRFVAITALALGTVMRPSTTVAACLGDCSSNQVVTVDEILLGVNIALGTMPIDQCGTFDSNGDQQVTVDEIITAVNHALNGCPAYGGNYSGSVTFDAQHQGSIQLSVDANGHVSGALLVSAGGAASRFQPNLTFPAGGVSATLSGSVDLNTGTFSVSGSFVDGDGQTVSVTISGTLPGPSGQASVTVQVGSDTFTGTVNAGSPPTPTPPSAVTATPTPTATPSPTSAPVGSPRIVYAGGSGDFNIFVIGVDGSGKTKLTNNAGTNSYPAWSPDGTKIAFSTPYQTGNDIAVMNADGSNPHLLTQDSGLNYFPAWSPDGTRIVFVAGGGDVIDIMNADGSNRHQLVSRGAVGETYGHLSWCPDGTRIAFESTRPKGGSSDSKFEIWAMNPDGTELVQLTNNDASDRWPAWRRDTLRIAFDSQRGFSNRNLYIMNLDGAGQTQLTQDPFAAAHPAWSHDGTQIAYSSLLGLRVANANGSNAVTVPGTDGSIKDFDFK